MTKDESKCSKFCEACKGMDDLKASKMCPVKNYTFGVPACFGNYDDKKEFCEKVCKYLKECK